MARIAEPGYDASVCFLNYIDGDWLFVKPASACKDSTCSWDVSADPYIKIPPPYNTGPFSYICNNELQSLPWKDQHHQNDDLPNRYLCTCGGALSNNTQCLHRCDRPWQASFGKRCNVVSTNRTAKGYYTDRNADPSKGACLIAAGSGLGSNSFPDPTYSADPSVIDGIGITFSCGLKSFYNGYHGYNQCSCDGELPAEAFGQPVANRDPCNLSKEAPNWIAAPIVGGVAAVIVLGVLAYILRRKRKHSRHSKRQPEDIAMQDLTESFAVEGVPWRTASSREVTTTSPGTAAHAGAEGPESPAISQVASTDSGVALFDTAGSSRARGHEQPAGKAR